MHQMHADVGLFLFCFYVTSIEHLSIPNEFVNNSIKGETMATSENDENSSK